jgi:hypothetical protein
MEARPLLPLSVKPVDFNGLGDGGGVERLWELVALQQDLFGSSGAMKRGHE